MTPAARSRWRRWSLVAAGVAALLCLPALVAAVPADGSATTAVALADRARASAGVPHSGYVVARGGFELPDVPRTGDLGALLGGVSRLRVWWAAPERWRVDRLLPAGEVGTYSVPEGPTPEAAPVQYRFDSLLGTAVRTAVPPGVRLPKPPDLLPDELARRLLADAGPEQLSRLPPRRVAGQDADGLRLVPDDPRVLAERVDLWVEPRTGLPLTVEVYARGARTPTVETSFLDLALEQPPATEVAVPPFADTERIEGTDVDVAAALDREAPLRLPDTLAGLPQRDRVAGGLADVGGGTATYGDGLTLLALAPLPRDLGDQVLDRLAAPAGVELSVDAPRVRARMVQTPLVTLAAARVGRRSYLVTGTLGPDALATALQQLAVEPPEFRS